MGSITSLIDGSTLHYNELVTVTYNSGALAFGPGAGQIATLVFEQNGVPKSTRNTIPTPAPATYSAAFALPTSGPTALIKVHAKNTMGMVLETVKVTINLIPYAAANCAGATGQTLTGLTLNGTIAGIPAGGSVRFRYGTANGGPYPSQIAATPYAVGAVAASLTGLSAGTVYYYVLEVLDASATVVAVSAECSAQTLADASQAGPACPVPPYVDNCPPTQTYIVGGVEYLAYQLCDKATNTPILVVFRLCDGEPSGTPTYYDLAGQPYTPAGAVGPCDASLDYEVLCDKGTNPNTRILALWDTSTVPPTLQYFTPGADGSLVTYVPVGPVGACVPANVDPIILCDDNGSFLRHVVYSDDGATVSMIDTDLEGVVYAPVGDIKNCGASGKALIEACDQTTTTTGNVPGVCGTNQQVVDAVDIQDAEEKNPTTGASAINVNDNDLELAGTAEVGETDWQIAVRFNMGIPQGAQICAAYIQFTSRGTTSVGTLAATISGEAADNSSLFTTAAGMLTARTKTVANVAWNVPSWPTGSQSGADQRTPDLSAIVQEIVDRPGWAAGNATAFFFVPGTTGYRRAQSITSGTAVAPKLHVEYVVDTTGATETICIPFYKEIDLSTGIATGNNYRLNAGIWEAYTPAGTVTDGECICPGTPGDGGTEFEILCLQDANNVRFARVVAIDGATGQYKKVGDYSLDFAGAYTPVGMVAPCSDSLDSEVIALCDNNGSFLRHVVYDANGNVQTVYNTALDGLTAYTPVGTIRACSGSDTEVVQLCDVSAAGVVTPFLRHLTYSSDGTSATIRNTALDGVTAYIPAGTIKTCHVQVPATIDARLREIVAAAAPVTQPIAAIIPAGKRLISLVMSVVAGTATVVDAGNVNTVTNIPTGYSASWSVANDDTLTFPVSITAAANSRILLSFTVR